MTLTSGRAHDGRSPTGALAGSSERAAVVRAARQLRATTVEVDVASLPDLVRAGGGPGRCLWRKTDLSLLGVGEALRLPLPPSWADRRHTDVVAEALKAVEVRGGAGIPGGPDGQDGAGGPGTGGPGTGGPGTGGPGTGGPGTGGPGTGGPGTGGPGAAAPVAGPLALGALPYDPAAGGQLVVPRLLVAKAARRAWATLTVPVESSLTDLEARQVVEAELAAMRREPAPAELPDGFELSSPVPHAQWKQLVERAVAEMGRGAMSKVVLARQVQVVANRPFVLHDVLARLATLYPSCTVFNFEGFIGASPEVLLRRHGRQVLSHPLAGTVARSGDAATDEGLLAGLLASDKDRREHQMVVDAIASVLGPLCDHLDVPATPSVLELRNVSHLGTVLSGRLLAGEDPPTSLELTALLQPTPAVGGHPTAAALRWQRENEDFDRGYYAGPVGWVDANGDGEWALGLRSATLAGNRAVLYAGSGIVAGSDPGTELAETQLKLQALLAALVRP